MSTDFVTGQLPSQIRWTRQGCISSQGWKTMNVNQKEVDANQISINIAAVSLHFFVKEEKYVFKYKLNWRLFFWQKTAPNWSITWQQLCTIRFGSNNNNITFNRATSKPDQLNLSLSDLSWHLDWIPQVREPGCSNTLKWPFHPMWSSVLLLEMVTEQIKVGVGGCGELYGNPPAHPPTTLICTLNIWTLLLSLSCRPQPFPAVFTYSVAAAGWRQFPVFTFFLLPPRLHRK